ncbi:hypothetical protein Zm00014a_021482 [Zea mays]|nr:hypothetical protein Zm00014a_021482 [Zea mays]
MSQSMP